MLLCDIIRIKGGDFVNLHISKSKNAESFYIAKSYVKENGCTSSTIVRKLGTLEQLLVEHGPTRDDVLAWAKNEVKLETEKYKKEQETKTVLVSFRADSRWIMINSYSTEAVIFFYNPFIMVYSSIKHAEN